MGGPVGLFCTSLAEHKAAITIGLAFYAWPTFSFHMLYCPYQQVKAHYSIIAASSHSHFLNSNRTAMANLGTLDKATHQLATRGLTATQRNQLTAIQSLGIWDGAKQLKF